MLDSSFQTVTTASFTESESDSGRRFSETDDWLNDETYTALAILRDDLDQLWHNQQIPCFYALERVRQNTQLFRQTQTKIFAPFNAEQIEPWTHTLHAIFSQILTTHAPLYESSLTLVFFAIGLRIRALQTRPGHEVNGISTGPMQARREQFQLLYELGEVGLAGPQAQIPFAHAADRLLTELVTQKFGTNQSQISIIEELKKTAHEDFEMSVACFFEDNNHVSSADYPYRTLRGQTAITLTSDDYVDRAVQKLITLRTTNLYTTIETLYRQPLECGELLDLMHYLGTHAARQKVCEAFTLNLRSKLLHQARSTTFILDTFIRIIMVFKAIDPSGIILFRVAEPIKQYLCNRDDAVRVILSSLLDGSLDKHGRIKPSSETFSASVAGCMDDEDQGGMGGEWHEAMDFQNLDWQPEPIDAAVGHEAARNLSAMAHLVTLSPADSFIKELQNVLCERLLQPHHHSSLSASSTHRSFDREIRLLNMFTLRFSEYHIQSLEVMLQDVLSSQKINSLIQPNISTSTPGPRRSTPRRSTKRKSRRTADVPTIGFSATLLSLPYWPSSLASQTSATTSSFSLPVSVAQASTAYEEQYKAVKKYRRLEWLHTLGNATVHLELEDRTLNIECTTWQAVVIDAIAELLGSSTNSNPGVSAARIAEKTGMDVDLVSAACAFWVSQRVIAPLDTDATTYSILERLPDAQSRHSQPPPAAAATAQIQMPASDPLKDNAAIYSQFVIGMLTNQGAMTSARILAMLKLAVPGGFPFGETELVDGVLVPLVHIEKVARDGSRWRVVR